MFFLKVHFKSSPSDGNSVFFSKEKIMIANHTSSKFKGLAENSLLLKGRVRAGFLGLQEKSHEKS